MHHCADFARLTPDERLREVASMLGIGILRRRQRAALPTADAEKKSFESAADGLEVSDKTVLSVHTG